jgi:hypothetical protein
MPAGAVEDSYRCGKGIAMKRFFVGISLAVLLVSFVLSLSGCTLSQPGETTAEGSRRHVRALRLNNQEMNHDLDAFFLLDEPSSLTEHVIP